MKLVDALKTLAQSATRPDSPRISLVCGFTPLHLQTFLQAYLALGPQGRLPVIETGLYGDLLGNLERVDLSASDVAIVVVEWSDLDSRLSIRSSGKWGPSVLDDIVSTCRQRLEAAESRINRIAAELPAIVALTTLPLSPVAFTPGWQASSFDAELRSQVATMAARLARNPRVRVLNPQRIDACSPSSTRFDASSELAAGFPYTLQHASTLAELLARMVCCPTRKKALITDLDDTLWKGILGEIGIEGISWDLDHRSQIHGTYQRVLDALSSEGILIGIASKNDPRLIHEALQRPDLLIHSQSLFPIEAGWGSKSIAVQRILHTWNIGADAAVFVDDSPMELAEVKAAHPAIECLLFPSRAHEVYTLIEQLRDLFGTAVLLEEDTIRLRSIRTRTVLLPAKPAVPPFVEYPDAKIKFDCRKDSFDRRALELINKTNQFNLNGHRHTEASWNRYFNDPAAFVLTATYTDKFGPLGKIAVIAGCESGDTLIVDSWVMSCRAFARGIEHQCLRELFDRFLVKAIEFRFAATERNGPMEDFLSAMLGRAPSWGCCLYRDQFLSGLSSLKELTVGLHG